MKFACVVAGGVSALLIASSPVQAAGLLGDTVQVIEYYPALGDQYGPIAGPDVIPGGGYTFTGIGYSYFSITVDPTQITLNGNGSYCCAGYFNGFDIQDLTAGRISSVSLAASGGLPSAGLTFDAHDVFVNVANANITGPIVIDLGTAGGVPEPAAWALMLIGVGGVGSAMRARPRPAPVAD